MEMAYVKGWVPKAFLDWFDCQVGNTRHEAKMLGKCYLEEVAEAEAATLFAWLEQDTHSRAQSLQLSQLSGGSHESSEPPSERS